MALHQVDHTVQALSNKDNIRPRIHHSNTSNPTVLLPILMLPIRPLVLVVPEALDLTCVASSLLRLNLRIPRAVGRHQIHTDLRLLLSISSLNNLVILVLSSSSSLNSLVIPVLNSSNRNNKGILVLSSNNLNRVAFLPSSSPNSSHRTCRCRILSIDLRLLLLRFNTNHHSRHFPLNNSSLNNNSLSSSNPVGRRLLLNSIPNFNLFRTRLRVPPRCLRILMDLNPRLDLNSNSNLLFRPNNNSHSSLPFSSNRRSMSQLRHQHLALARGSLLSSSSNYSSSHTKSDR